MLAGCPTSKILPAVSVRSSSGYYMISGFEFPKQERTDRIAAHYRVEKLLDVFGLPNELSLDSGARSTGGSYAVGQQ